MGEIAPARHAETAEPKAAAETALPNAGASRQSAMHQVHRSLKAWRDRERQGGDPGPEAAGPEGAEAGEKESEESESAEAEQAGPAEEAEGESTSAKVSAKLKSLSRKVYRAERAKKMQPAESSVWKSFASAGNGRKTSGDGKGKRYYEWDYLHGEIEMYDSKGKHLGVLDPNTGAVYKPAVPGRKIDV